MASFCKQKKKRVAVNKLNELEYIDGYVYANIWYSDQIAIVDPKSGLVRKWIDCGDLAMKHGIQGVLNGIAYDKERKQLLLTGKNWNKMYLVNMVHVTHTEITSQDKAILMLNNLGYTI